MHLIIDMKSVKLMRVETYYKLINISVGDNISSWIFRMETGPPNGIDFLNKKSILALVI